MQDNFDPFIVSGTCQELGDNEKLGTIPAVVGWGLGGGRVGWGGWGLGRSRRVGPISDREQTTKPQWTAPGDLKCLK